MRITNLDALQIRELLYLLGAELHKNGISGELYLVGGAAIALAYDFRRTTRDLDAVFEPKMIIYDAAHRIANEMGLEEDWLNDAVKGLVPPGDPAPREVLSVPGLTVLVPSPEFLLAMKVAAARVDRDGDDIRFLANLLGLTTAAEVLEITFAVWGDPRRIPPKSSFFVQEIFGPLQD